ncbi:MAG: phage head-tail adapter protein [Lachnospiraceae bacterium]|nr:phage head-tail adapter protein [Lachnospiraceae bacterium]
MNKEWSQKNKEIQILLGKEPTYKEGVRKLISFREELFEQISNIVNNYPKEAFYQMPFKGANGYHSKTLAYSIWHIFRIEDIVAHELIKKDKQILFTDSYEKRIHAPVITTGNELDSEKIVAFSKDVDVDGLSLYAKAVMESTNAFLPELSYDDMKCRFTDADKAKLIDSKCVSTDENAVWLIDYWCGKDVRGLLKMPFSRHWIMHIEAMLRIKNQLCKIAGK